MPRWHCPIKYFLGTRILNVCFFVILWCYFSTRLKYYENVLEFYINWLAHMVYTLVWERDYSIPIDSFKSNFILVMLNSVPLSSIKLDTLMFGVNNLQLFML